MTVLVSVKINDGVVMAADSASSFASGMVYGHADKIVNLRQGLPIGAMVTGAGGIGNELIDTLLKDLRHRFNGEDEARTDWALDPARYTLAQVANRLRSFLFEEKPPPMPGRSGPGCGCAVTPRDGRSPRFGEICCSGPTRRRQPKSKASRISGSGGMGNTGSELSDFWAWDRF